MKPKIWHSFTIKKTLNILNTSVQGLDEAEVIKRKQEFGANQMPHSKRLTGLQIFFRQFKNTLIYILLVASAISFLLNELVDMFIILAVIGISVVISFFQEYKADRSLWELKKAVKLQTIVLRSGIKKSTNITNLVPGDIVLLEAGNKVPADIRLLETKNFQCVQALLTGESVPNDKHTEPLDKETVLADRDNMAYMGTIVSRGKAIGVVVAIGQDTEMGKIAKALRNETETPTPLQKQITDFSKKLGMLIGILVLIIFIFGILVGRDFYEMLLTSVVLAVASVPEGLPAGITIVLALGMQKIYQKKGLVRRMSAAETLGCTTVICTDKTGTLTLGKLYVDKILTFEKNDSILKSNIFKLNSKNIIHESHSELLKFALLSSFAYVQNPTDVISKWKVNGDGLDGAVLIAAARHGFKKNKIEKQMTMLEELNFDEVRKYSASLNVFDETQNIISIKGAPEEIMKICSFIDLNGKKEKIEQYLNEINTYLEKMTEKGLRVIAVGKKTYKKFDKKYLDKSLEDIDFGFTFLGFLAFKDPLRKEARDSIKIAKKAGIRPIIVTGDHKLTAISIAKEIGIKAQEYNVLQGSQLEELNDEQLKEKIKTINIFSRVEPKHKIRIVKCLKSLGEVVAMTGDGINDAPAIKAADIGIALGEGSDVTKETADMILLNNNFATIQSAIERGRVIYDNIKKVVLYLLSDAFSEIILIGGALLLGLPLPLLPAQILWINLIQDGFPSIALAFEPKEKNIMQEKPRKLNEKLLDTEMKILILIIGVIVNIALLAIVYYFWKADKSLDYVRSMVFLTFGLDSLLYVFSIRSLKTTIFQKNPFSNKLLVFSFFLGITMMFVALYIPFFRGILNLSPLTLSDWILPLELAIVEILLIEFIKYIFIIKKKKSLQSKQIVWQKN